MREGKLRIGVIGLVHDHVWGHMKRANNLDKAEIVAIADEHGELLKKAKEITGVKNLYENYLDLISNENIDVALVCTGIHRHAEITKICAENNINVFADKPMSPTLEQAKKMMSYVKESKIKLMIDYPATTWNEGIRYAKKLIDDGAVGDIYQIHHRTANFGPEKIGCSSYFLEWLFDENKNGGGAIIDYGCYGVKVCKWILGQPDSVMAIAGTHVKENIDVDDNAVILLKYKNATGIVSASWSQLGYKPNGGPIFLGTGGNIEVERVSQHGDRPINWRGEVKSVNLLANGYTSWLPLTPPSLPKGKKSGIEYFVNAILNNEKLEDPCGPEFNLEVQQILEAGLRSVHSGKEISLPIE